MPVRARVRQILGMGQVAQRCIDTLDGIWQVSPFATEGDTPSCRTSAPGLALGMSGKAVDEASE